MTSHITVSAPNTGTAASGLSTTGKPATGGPLGAFGAILDSFAAGSGATTPTAATTDTPAARTGFTAAADAPAAAPDTPSILDLLERLLHLNEPRPQATAGTATVPLAATAAADATAAAGASDAGTPPKLLKDVIAALKDLDKARQAGGPVGDDLLKKARTVIDALAAFLAGQPALAPPAAGAGDPAAGAGTAIAGAGASDTRSGQAAAARLATAQASLAALADKLATLSQSTAGLDPDLSAKLETLARALDPKTLSQQTISALGLDSADAAADPQLANAIAGLVNGKAQGTAALQPALGTPQLKLPDALGDPDKGATPDRPAAGAGGPSRNAASPSSAAATQPAARDAASDHRDNAGKSPDDQAKTAAAAATAATDKPADAISAQPATPPAAAAAATAPAAAARLAQATYQAASPVAVNLPQMAYEIVRHVQQGESHFQIRLDPADMGRVDVRLAIDQSGAVSAHLTVERTDTLDLLRRDASQLNQALNQAGLDAGRANLQFSLSQNPFTRQDNGTQSGASLAAGYDAAEEAVDTPAVATVYRGSAASGLNLFV